MGLFHRLRTFLSSLINDFMSKRENPERILNQLIVDMNQQLIESKKAVALAIADEKKLARETEEQRQLAADWHTKAMVAVKAQKDDLAKEALIRQQEHQLAHDQLNQHWTAQKQSVDGLKDGLRMLQGKIEDATRKRNLLVARAKRAEAQEKIQNTISSVSSDTSTFEAFDRMALKVDEMEARAAAAVELENFTQNSSLEAQIKQLEMANQSPEALLEELKVKMLTDQTMNEEAEKK